MSERNSIEEGMYEADTINLLTYGTYEDDKVLDRVNVIIEWIQGFSRKQLRVYKRQVSYILYLLKDVLEEIENRGD